MDKVWSRDGTGIAYERHGRGSPLVLVDGAFGVRGFGTSNAEVGELLADAHTVYDYDRRGRGDSDETTPYAIEREVEDLAAVIALAGEPADVCGLSSGAVLALDAAAAGVPVRRLVLHEPPAIVDGARPPVPSDFLERLDAALAEGRYADAVQQFFVESVGVPAAAAATAPTWPIWSRLVAAAPTLAHDGRILDGLMDGTPLPAGRWAGVDVPLLVLHGGDTAPWMQVAAGAVAGLFPRAQRQELPGERHDVSAAALAPALRAFLSG